MIIRSKAPLRLGLAGGGSDVSPYSDIYGGLVLNATINLYAYCIIEETSDGFITIDSKDSGTKERIALARNVDDSGGARLIKGVYNRVMRDFNCEMKSFAITTYNDAPAGSGLGTSSTMVVAILKAFVEWLSLPLGDYEIARLAFEIERVDLNLSGGKQDQYAASFGGFNYMEFQTSGTVIVNPLKVKRWIVDELQASLVLYFTGRSRSSASIIDEQMRNSRTGEASYIGNMHKIKQSAVDMKLAILKGDMNEFSRILGNAWEAKKKMAGSITNPVIEKAFETAFSAGAESGKVSGAGGGGFIIFFVNPKKKQNLIGALAQLDGYVMPFEFTDGGAHGWKIYETDTITSY